MMTVLERIAAERKRQIEEEGWTLEHDDGHTGGELAMAAACYAAPEAILMDRPNYGFGNAWPFRGAMKQRPRIRELVVAAALIVAEIERLERKG